jgi:hypothetical protein
MTRSLIQGTSTSGGTVTVYWAGTTVKPTIYVSATGASKANPITANFDGSYSFYIDDGHYKIVNGLPTGDINDLRVLYAGESRPSALDISVLPFRANTATTLESWLEGQISAPTFPTLTATRVPYIGTAGLLTDSGNMTYVATTATGGLSIGNTTTSGSITTGSLITAGGIGVAKASYFGETGNFAGQLNAAASTTSTTPLTGALITAGGLGVVKAAYFGESIGLQSANGAGWVSGMASELLTLSIAGATTDTTANLLPANSIIDAVVARVTTTITTATDWKLGDPTSDTRFAAANATMTAGSTSIGLLHMAGNVATTALGPTQAAAAKVRVTTTGTPGAGAIRITVFYRTFIAPTS